MDVLQCPLLTQSGHRALQFGSVARCQKTRLGCVDLSTSIAACDQVAKLKGENGNHSCQTPQKAL
jgi:hypothetical protein